MRIAVCDDDWTELQRIESKVHEFACLNKELPVTVSAFGSGEDLLSFLGEHGGFDLFILDIVMPGMNGIELAAKIRETDGNCKIIFLSSSKEYALDSYKVKAYYYILKSNIQDELMALLQRAAVELEAETTSSIYIKEKHRRTRVPFSSIEYVESSNHTVYFHLHNNETVTSYSTIKAYHDVMLSDARFIKCHKSFIVNMDYVTSITGNSFILDSGIEVPISRNLFGAVKIKYFDYFLISERN